MTTQGPQQFLQNPYGRMISIEEYVASGFHLKKVNHVPALDGKIDGKTVEEINEERTDRIEARGPGENLNAPGTVEKAYKDKLEQAKEILESVETPEDPVVPVEEVTTPVVDSSDGISEAEQKQIYVDLLHKDGLKPASLKWTLETLESNCLKRNLL